VAAVRVDLDGFARPRGAGSGRFPRCATRPSEPSSFHRPAQVKARGAPPPNAARGAANDLREDDVIRADVRGATAP